MKSFYCPNCGDAGKTVEKTRLDVYKCMNCGKTYLIHKLKK